MSIMNKYQGQEAMVGNAICPRTPDAERIMIMLDECTEQSEELVSFAAGKLGSLAHPEPPATGESNPVETMMAPLFGEYRDRVRKLQTNMARMRYIVERVEV